MGRGRGREVGGAAGVKIGGREGVGDEEPRGEEGEQNIWRVTARRVSEEERKRRRRNQRKQEEAA